MSAFLAESPENEFGFANSPLAQRARARPRHIVPIHVFHIAAAIANEVVMPDAFGIEARRTAFDGYFTDQTGLHQIPQIVIGGCPGTAGIQAIHRRKDFRRRGMAGMFQQEFHHGVTLRRASQTAVLKGLFNRLGAYQVFRLSLSWHFVKG
jgi:hypothetical protein